MRHGKKLTVVIGTLVTGAALLLGGCSGGPGLSQGWIENINYEQASSYSLGQMPVHACLLLGGTPRYSLWYGRTCDEYQPASSTFTLCSENLPVAAPKNSCSPVDVPLSTWKQYGRLFTYWPPRGAETAAGKA